MTSRERHCRGRTRGSGVQNLHGHFAPLFGQGPPTSRSRLAYMHFHFLSSSAANARVHSLRRCRDHFATGGPLYGPEHRGPHSSCLSHTLDNGGVLALPLDLSRFLLLQPVPAAPPVQAAAVVCRPLWPPSSSWAAGPLLPAAGQSVQKAPSAHSFSLGTLGLPTHCCWPWARASIFGFSFLCSHL